MFASHLRLAIVLAALGTHVASAQARPLHVVVLDFDGRRALCEASRSIVMDIVGDRDDVYPRRAWTRAFARASERGSRRWRQASAQTGADAVIEGFLTEQGRHYALTLVVRRARNGDQIDDATVNVDPDGMTDEARHELQHDVDRILDWLYDHP
jgi:hypothetical protein